MNEALGVCGWLWLLWAALWALAALRTSRTAVQEPRWQRLQHTLPSALTAVLLMWHASWPWLSSRWLDGPARWAGAAATAAGIAFCAWARWHIGRYWSGEVVLKEGHRLVRTGPYGLVRHPIYTGILLAIAGTAVAQGRLAGLLAVVVAAVTFTRKLRREEALMLSAFGPEYERFRREVPALLPKLKL